jgi:hypothetical protein
MWNTVAFVKKVVVFPAVAALWQHPALPSNLSNLA